MYNHEPKEYQCPLCPLIKGQGNEITNQQDIVYQNKFITAFVSGKWWKSNRGHVIIIPNKHFENIYDLPQEFAYPIQDATKEVAIALKKIYRCDGTSIRQHNEPAGGQDVFHYHIHIFPRYENDNLYLNDKETYWPSLEERSKYAEKLRKYFIEREI